MLQVNYSPQLAALVEQLDDPWEAGRIATLPFPVAYPLARLRGEGYPWDYLLKDVLHALLKYLALIGVSAYLRQPRQPDFDLNDAIKKLAAPMHEGQWLSLIRRCAGAGLDAALPGYSEALEQLDTGKLRACLTDPKHAIELKHEGVLSCLVALRNRAYAHGVSFSADEKAAATPAILRLLRVAVHGAEPIFAHRLVQVVETRGGRRTLVLCGVERFADAGEDVEGSALALAGGGRLRLFPMVLAQPPGRGQAASLPLVDAEADVYLLNELKETRTPIYLGLTGGRVERKELASPVAALLDAKRVLQTRQDVRLEETLEFSRRAVFEQLESATWSNLYDPGRFVSRPALEQALDAFLDHQATRAVLVSGASGTGKTTAVLRFLHARVSAGDPCLLLRAVELEAGIVKPDAFGRHITARLAYPGSFDDVLEMAARQGRRFLVVIEGLNEFTASDRDASLLFRAISHWLGHVKHRAALKVIVTARHDNLDMLQPGGRWPGDVDDLAWFTWEGRPRVEVGPLTVDEARALLARSAVPEERAKQILDLPGEVSRNPVLLMKLALGSLAREDFATVNATTVMAQYIDRRLGTDRALRASVDGLLQTMEKVGDLRLDEDTLQRRAPRLYAQLTGGGQLVTLRDLGLVQVVERRTEEGLTRWSVALAHDSLVDAIVARQRRRALLRSFVVNSVLLALLVVAFHVVTKFLGVQLDLARAQLHQRVTVAVEAGFDADADVSGDPGAAVRSVTRDAVELVDAVHGKHEVQVVAARRVGWLFGCTATLCMLFMDAASFRTSRTDSGDPRVRFYGQAEELRATARLTRSVVPVLVVVVVIAVLLMLQEAPLWAVLALPVALLVVLIVGGIPGLAMAKVYRARRGSRLLGEFVFGSEGLRRLRRTLLQLSGVLTVGVSTALLVPFLPLSWLAPHEAATARQRIVEAMERFDQRQLSSIGTGSITDRLEALGRGEGLREFDEITGRGFFSWDSADVRLLVASVAAGLIVIVVILLGVVVYTDRAARRWRKEQVAGPR